MAAAMRHVRDAAGTLVTSAAVDAMFDPIDQLVSAGKLAEAKAALEKLDADSKTMQFAPTAEDGSIFPPEQAFQSAMHLAITKVFPSLADRPDWTNAYIGAGSRQ